MYFEKNKRWWILFEPYRLTVTFSVWSVMYSISKTITIGCNLGWSPKKMSHTSCFCCFSATKCLMSFAMKDAREGWLKTNKTTIWYGCCVWMSVTIRDCPPKKNEKKNKKLMHVFDAEHERFETKIKEVIYVNLEKPLMGTPLVPFHLKVFSTSSNITSFINTSDFPVPDARADKCWDILNSATSSPVN